MREFQSFASAAHRMHTSQSTVSRRIAKLEHVVGQPVFDRSRRTPKLTACGEYLLEGTEKLLSLPKRIARMLHVVPDEHVRHG